MEIPRSVSFDFLITLLGVGVILVPLQFNFFSSQPLLSLILIVIGCLILFQGITYMKESYSIERDIKELEYVQTKEDLLNKLREKSLISDKNKIEIENKLRFFVVSRQSLEDDEPL